MHASADPCPCPDPLTGRFTPDVGAATEVTAIARGHERATDTITVGDPEVEGLVKAAKAVKAEADARS